MMRFSVAFVAVFLAAGKAGAFEVSSVSPGCGQQMTWCERAAAVSYGDPERFRKALSVIVARDWTAYFADARRRTPHTSTPDIATIVADIYRDWQNGSVCCNVSLSTPGSDVGEPDYAGMCRRGDDQGAAGQAARQCIEAVSSARTKKP